MSEVRKRFQGFRVSEVSVGRSAGLKAIGRRAESRWEKFCVLGFAFWGLRVTACNYTDLHFGHRRPLPQVTAHGQVGFEWFMVYGLRV